ncbi:MAG: hypothetical protein PHC53_04070 [Patescibacteria group bacterium]|nr:hypothetical protein [Patescibacteria group bacterium]
MTIAICVSLDFTHEIAAIKKKLEELGHQVNIPPTSEAILRGEVSVDDIRREKEDGTFASRSIEDDAIRRYWRVIKDSDALLVANYDKKGIKDYIGGNALMEMGFTHVLEKPIYLLNGIPDMGYTDEIKAMQPIVLHGDLSKIGFLNKSI